MPPDDFIEIEEDTGGSPADSAALIAEKRQQVLRERQGAYARIFGAASKDDQRIVMEDLAEFCRAYQTPFTDNERSTALLIGRGEVYQRIVQFARLSNDELFYLYHERALRKAQNV